MNIPVRAVPTMLRSDRWNTSLIGIVAAAVRGLVIFAAALGCGALAPRPAALESPGGVPPPGSPPREATGHPSRPGCPVSGNMARRSR